MSTFVGTVKKNDLEGGFWELVDSNGEHYQLQGGDAALQVEGQKVEIEGSIRWHLALNRANLRAHAQTLRPN